MSDLSVVLLGNSAVGKSSSGNTILGRSVFWLRSSHGQVTTKICESTETVHGRQLSVFDTPGILINSDATQNIRQQCEHMLHSGWPTVFLVVLKVDRVSPDQMEGLEKIMEVLGDEGMKRSLLLFTYGAALEGQALEGFIYEDDESPLPEIYSMFGQRHHVFDNVAWGQRQVLLLLQKIDQLLSELVSSAREPLALGPPYLNEMRLVLLGLPGAGKSSSGNSILGSDQFKTSCGFDAVSIEAECKKAEVRGRQVTVVDTPGFSDVGQKPKKLFKCIMKSVLQLTAGPHAFIIVVRVGRIGTRKEAKILELIPRLFDEVASNFTMVLFTHGDNLGGERIDNLIKQNPTMRELVAKCDQRYMVFNNTRRDRVQIEQLFKMIDDMVQASGQDYCNSHIFKLTTAEEIQEFFDMMWQRIKPLFCGVAQTQTNEDEEVLLQPVGSTSSNTDQE